MRFIFMAAAVMMSCALAPGADAAACPIGTFPGFDNFGNSICKSFDTGGVRSVQNNGPGCPAGMIPDFDNFGNRACKTLAGQRFYDTSKGCPISTVPGFDNFGNKICQRF